MLCMPNVAIHQNREVNEQGLKLNPQTELCAILGSVAEGLPKEGALRWILAEDLDVLPDHVLDFDLFLHDAQKASYGGFSHELIRSGRLDDLAMCHAAIRALCGAAPTNSTQVVALVDHEEVGSRTAEGALGSFAPSVLERICIGLGDSREGYLAALAQTTAVSADAAHAAHPGFTAKMEPHHAPVLNGGPVIKSHAGRSYATDGYSASVFELACRKAGVPFQRFVNRSDVRSGSTIGAMLAAKLGIRTVDVGNAQYAMHSVRETAGAWDHWYMTEAMRAYLAT
jgi:aspartyl aminopeptidase